MEAINEVKWRNELRTERTEFEVTVRENGKIIYQNTAFAGCLNVVETVDEFDTSDMSFRGITQSLHFGHPAIVVFSLDQLTQKMKPTMQLAIQSLIKYAKAPWLKKKMEDIAKYNTKNE